MSKLLALHYQINTEKIIIAINVKKKYIYIYQSSAVFWQICFLVRNVLLSKILIYLSGFCCVCHLFLPLVSIFGLFPVLVSCHYELSMFQLCLSRYVLITLCILVLSFEFDFGWSTRYFPGVSCPCQSCLVLP